MSEIERIKERYERRKEIPAERYSLFNPGNLFIVQERERAMLTVLREHGMTPLTGRKILEVGCGTGGWLPDFVRWGALPENLYGVDILQDRIYEAKRRMPGAKIIYANAEHLPFTDGSFDIVLQSTVFTSIHEFHMKANIAREMIRVLKPGGVILWYDFRYNNPCNPDVRGVRKSEIDLLFPDLQREYHTLTLVPFVTRFLAPCSWLACYVLSKIPFFRTHYLVVIWKQRGKA